MNQEVQKDEKLNVESIKWGKIAWTNIERPTRRDIEYLAQNYLFNLFDLEDCMSRIERPKIDEYDNYLFIVLHFPVFKKDAHVTIPSQVAIFIAEGLIVTVHSGELKPLANLFNDCQQNERAREENMSRSSGYLLYRILDRLVDYCFPITNKIITNVEEAEDRLFSEPLKDTVREISFLRRDVMACRRIIRPQYAILKSLEIKDYPFLKEDLEAYFGDIGDHISKINDTLEEYKEVVEGLNVTSDSLFSHRSNEAIKMLTVVGTIILPLLVMSGLYGMNVALPFGDSPYAFLFIILITLFISGSMLAYFRFRRWI
jgi:magnesium transporter